MKQGDFHDPYRANNWSSGPGADAPVNSTLIAVGVGVGAVAIIGTAMYFLGGREAPRVPSLDELGAFGKREIGLGALSVVYDLPDNIRSEYSGGHIRIGAARDPYNGDIIVTAHNTGNGKTWKDRWVCHRDSEGNCFYTLGDF